MGAGETERINDWIFFNVHTILPATLVTHKSTYPIRTFLYMKSQIRNKIQHCFCHYACCSCTYCLETVQILGYVSRYVRCFSFTPGVESLLTVAFLEQAIAWTVTWLCFVMFDFLSLCVGWASIRRKGFIIYNPSLSTYKTVKTWLHTRSQQEIK